MPRVFISYVRENSGDVQRLADSLRAHGVEVWLDREQIKPGYRWADAIREAISQGDFFIACFSSESNSRSRSYMNEELTLAIDELRQRPTDRAWFVPALLSDCEVPNRSIGGGETLNSIQWISLYENWADGIQRILDVIQPKPLPIPMPEKLRREALRSQIIVAMGELQRRSRDPVLLDDITNLLPKQLPSEEIPRELEQLRHNRFIHFDGVFVDNATLITPLPPINNILRITNNLGMKFVLIPPGIFQMGSIDGVQNEREIHWVTISKPFYLGVYVVIQAQWRAVMGNEPWKGMPNVQEGDEYPAIWLSWEDTEKFIKSLKNRDRANDYRLPTEAEWEYAARAGSIAKFSFGDDEQVLGDYGWFEDNVSPGEKYPHLVGKKSPNPWGLYDMHGNVWEWVADWYFESYLADSVMDPEGPTSDSHRVLRGGAFDAKAGEARSAYRAHTIPSRINDSYGFRLVMMPL